MRLTTAVTALLSCTAAAATSPQADVYLFRSEPATQSDAPQLPRQLARLIFLQRLGVDRWFPLGDEISGLPGDDEEAVSHINYYGKPMRRLFEQRPASEPSHLLVMLEGLEPSQMEEALSGRDKSFSIDEAPNAAAHGKLLDDELGPTGVAVSSCPFERAINPLDEECFGGSSSIIRFDVKRDKTILEALAKATPKLARFAETGEMETTLVLLPESSRSSRISSWSTHPSNLHRRQSETILSEPVALSSSASAAESSPSTAGKNASEHYPGLEKAGAHLPLCFTSYNACTTQTGKCSGHGDCENVWAGKDDEGNRQPAGDNAMCFKCICKKTRERSDGGSEKGKNGTVTQWAGDTCEKVDMTTEVSLFVGTGILLFLIVGGAVTLVYSVGDQPLPGVLGAGVSKTT